MIGGRPPIELDLDAVFAAAEETGTALEVNGALPRLDLSVERLRTRAGRATSTFVLTSDAHHARELERVDNAARNAEKAWTPRERVANAWPAERLAAWAHRGGPRDGRDHLLRALKLSASGHRSGGRTEGGARRSSRR
jgi:DNA polymerase (family 10)